jgi:hypothetical protein
MSRYAASYFGAAIDTDHGEGWITFRWPDELHGYDELTIDLDGHCSRRMPIHSGSGPPDFLELWHDGIRIRFDPILARKLQMEEEIKIFFHITDAEFDDLRRVFDYFNGPATST